MGLREATVDYLLNVQVEILGVTYPARKEGAKFFLPADCPVVAGQRIYSQGWPYYVLDAKRTPHAVIATADPVR